MNVNENLLISILMLSLTTGVKRGWEMRVQNLIIKSLFKRRFMRRVIWDSLFASVFFNGTLRVISHFTCN